MEGSERAREAGPDEKSSRQRDAQQQQGTGPKPSNPAADDRRSPGSLLPLRSADGDGLESGPKTESGRSSISHSDPEAGFVHIDGDVGGSGYNETNVDIVAVPCPGADPVQPWAGDEPFPDDYFGVPLRSELQKLPTVSELVGEAILSPALNRHLPLAGHLWVRQGIRKCVSTARVLLYKHRALVEGMTLDSLAEDLLKHVQKIREGLHPSRPLFFIAHSVGGLVVKRALTLSEEIREYRHILYNCHGVTFFGAPHRGSSYMSMPNMRECIRDLLQLERPLPQSLAGQLRLNSPTLLELHEDFIDLASEIHIWSIYETGDSQLSNSGPGPTSEVEFGAPLVSIKSSLLGIKQERVLSVDSDHANCASFGPKNPKTMASYLEKLSVAVAKAARLSERYIHTPLRLKEHVKVELVGFYDGPESSIRLYAAKIYMNEFLDKGPERCLEERLRRVQTRIPAYPAQFLSHNSGRGRGNGDRETPANAPKAPEGNRPGGLVRAQEPPGSPGIVITGPSRRTSVVDGSASPVQVAARRHSPSRTVPPLERPSFAGTGSTKPDPTQDISPTTGDAPVNEEDGTANSAGGNAGVKTSPGSETAAISSTRPSLYREPPAAPAGPDPALRKFMWIHLPFTNPLWVQEIFDEISEIGEQDFARLFNNENWVSRHVQGRHSQSQPSFVKPTCNYITSDLPLSPQPTPDYGIASPPAAGPNCFYLYLPYLNFDTYANIIKRRCIIKRRLKHGRARPVPKDIAELESLELRVIWQYIGFDPPLNCRRTLDQFGYPSLRDTYSRDDDQMLYKLTKRDRPRNRLLPGQNNRMNTSESFVSKKNRLSSMMSGLIRDDDSSSSGSSSSSDGDSDSDSESELDVADQVKEGNVLMVDQLWLWAVDTTTLATFFPKRESSPKEGPLFQQADLRNSVYNELNGDLTGRTENALDLAAFIALHAVTVLLDRSSHPNLEIFHVFEEAIGMLTEKMTQSLKQFRMRTFRETVGDPDLDDPEGNKPASIKKRYRLELEKAERENRENTSAMLELRDMEDELATLSRLFEAQESTIKTMRYIYMRDDLAAITVNGLGYLDQALARLDEYKQQTAEMVKRVDTTRKDYEKLLEMAQRQAQVQDMRWSRIQTELASSQNLSVMIFTTFTVIFLPLSFFTGLFGMNVVEWEADLPSFSFIGAISLPVSFFLIVASLVAAYSSRVQSWFKLAFRHLRNLLRAVQAALRGLQPEAARRAKTRREERERREVRAQRKKEKSYDFWATVKGERNSEYRIPVLNMKAPEKGKGGSTRPGRLAT